MLTARQEAVCRAYVDTGCGAKMGANALRASLLLPERRPGASNYRCADFQTLFSRM
jgi:hypothetical protein